jgi:hypothetical protein
MSTPDRLTTSGLRRTEANPAWRGLDPDAFKLHVEFMHSHGSPRGEITTFSGRVFSSTAAVDPSMRARGDGVPRR